MRPLQKEIIAALRVKPEIDPKEEIRTSIDFMKDYLAAHPFLKAFVLGISGGQDSTLTGRLAQLAIQEMRDETGDESYQFIAVRLPYGIQFDEHDAQAALDFISPDQKLVVNIKEMADAALDALEEAGLTITDFNKGNIKARQRMIVQFAIAGDSSGAVGGRRPHLVRLGHHRRSRQRARAPFSSGFAPTCSRLATGRWRCAWPARSPSWPASSPGWTR